MKYVVAKASEIAPGGRIVFEAGSRSIGVFRVGEEFFALRNRCPHMGGPLCLGAVYDGVRAENPGLVESDPGRKFIACPWHGWEYDLTDGQSYIDPRGSRVLAYDVAVEDVPPGTADYATSPTRMVSAGSEDGPQPGPFKVETFQASVEGEYVVVTVPGAAAR